jgi:1A family penicillin-binding protein
MKLLRIKLSQLYGRIYGRIRPFFHDLSIIIRKAQQDIRWSQYAGDALALTKDASRVGVEVVSPFFGLRARIVYIGILLFSLMAAGVFAINTAMATMKQYRPDIANPSIIMSKKLTGTTITDRNGLVLYQGFGATDRSNIGVNDVPDHFIKATLAIEDPEFYQHHGISIRGMTRALYHDLKHVEKAQGGSTITQQLVKTTLLTSEKSFTRKYKELLLALEIERRYSKEQILQMYMNTIYYGQGSYGVVAASKTYFNKAPKDLNLAESALLAGLAQSPSRYDPNVNLAVSKERRDFVLERMSALGYITQAVASKNQALAVKAGAKQVVIKAPHFVFFVLEQLEKTYGRQMVEKGGITVRTTLDYTKQQIGEEAVRTQVAKLVRHRASNGGLVSIDPKTGDILAMVGSIDYNQPQFGSFNVTLAQRQPGSSFKPIAYVTAFSKGWNGAVKVEDKPLRIPEPDGTVYEPKNYDLKFRGPVLLRRALANSLNIPALEVQKFAGISDTVAMAHRLGINSPSLVDQSRLGISLALGGGDVRAIDMATVYATFANQGVRIDPRPILTVEDRLGKDITHAKNPISRNVLDPRLAYMITNILSDNKTRAEIFGSRSPLVLSRPAAVKTGTTNDWRDNWAIGYTPNLVTAVWVGNNDNSPMFNIDGVTGAAPIWNQYMERTLATMPIEDFVAPSGLVKMKVCSFDGGLVDPRDPSGVEELFLQEAPPTKRCGADTKRATIRIVQPKEETPLQQAQVPSLPTAPGVGGGSLGNEEDVPGLDPNRRNRN